MTFDPAYPRDMTGYGRDAPDADWPNGKRIAVQFVLNYEEGGENNILHGDAASEAFLSEIVGAQPWPGQRHFNMESIYEYGARAGFWRLWRLFTQRGAAVTVFGVAQALARAREQVAAMREAGWEIATHGLKWIDYKDVPEATEREHIAEAIRLQTALTGQRPLGFYQGRASMNTVRLGMEEGGFLYLADSYADDLPYWLEGPHGPQLVAPYTLDANDMRFATPQGFNAGDQFFVYLKDSFDCLLREGRAGAAKMMSVGLHCRLVGRPGRAEALARFVDYVQSHDEAWIATRLDIARHWARRHPPTGGYRPSRMPRALFVELYGDVFEHTPAIAEAAHRRGLGAECDTAAGLHAALCAALRESGEDVKLSLIRAHPDLAGRLALAGGLTADSAREQAGSGLDRLSAEELARFTALNEAYKARFGFPFIMAVKGATKQQILEAFERRLLHHPQGEFAEALAQIEKIAGLETDGPFAMSESGGSRAAGDNRDPGAAIMARLDELARFSDDDGRLTRLYLSPSHRASIPTLRAWMEAAGMDVRLDAIGNLRGRYAGAEADAPTLYLGSHVDTVRDAGRYDGTLGVIAAIAVVDELNRRGARRPFAIEVLAFGDEEGVRFPTTLSGSRAVAGQFDPATLDAADADGVTLASALRDFGCDPAAIGGAAADPAQALAYVELHIEQGPALEAAGAAVGVVTAINGATRFAVSLTGEAGHAGTVPMTMRRDALAGAAEMILGIEARAAGEEDLVATVGRIAAEPGAINVIPGGAHFSVDIRSPRDAQRRMASDQIERSCRDIAARRGLSIEIARTHEAPAAVCDPQIVELLGASALRERHRDIRLASGAGHDAMIMARFCPTGMLFLRCAGGISHNPAESIIAADAAAGFAVLLDFVLNYAPGAPRRGG